MEFEQGDGVSGGRWSGREAVIERQALEPNRVREMAGLVLVTQQLDELGIVRGDQDGVLPAMAGIPEELPQDRFARGDSLDGVGAPEQLIKQEQVRV